MKKNINPLRKYISTISTLLTFVFFIYILFIPANSLDDTKGQCISRQIWNVECWFCDIMIALLYLVHGELKNAIFFNQLSFILLPLLIFQLVYFFYLTLRLWKPKS